MQNITNIIIKIMEKKITVFGTLSEGFAIGLKNVASIVGAVVLWIVTIWIPYINVGTTIAIASLPLELKEGKVFSPLSIFDKKYFKYMGEYILLLALIFIGTTVAAFFFFIPAIVIYMAWSLAILLLIDKELNPAEALTQSNKATHGYKWIIFGIYFCIGIAGFILSLIFNLIPILGIILNILVYIATEAIAIGCNAVIYKKLVDGVPASEEAPVTE